MRKRLFSTRHLTITALLVVAGLAGVTAGSAVLPSPAPDTWSMPALEPGMHAEYTYAAFGLDSAHTQLGPTRTLFAVDVLQPSLMLDANGRAHASNGYKVSSWGYGEDGAWEPRMALIGWGDEEKVVAFDMSLELVDFMPRNSSQLAGLMQTQTSTNAAIGMRMYMDQTIEEGVGATMLLPCGTGLPFQGKTVRLREIPSNPCMIFNLPSDPGAKSEEPITRDILEQSAMRVLGVVDDGATLVVQQKGDDTTFTMWLPKDKPIASKIVWSEKGIDHVISLAEFSTRPMAGADVPAQADITLPVVRPLVSGLPDDRGTDHPFPASEAWKAAQHHEDVVTFLSHHPDARVYNLEYAPTFGWTERAWRFSLAGDGEELGVRVALEEDNLYGLVWPEQRYAVSIIAPRDPPKAPVEAYPAKTPTVAGMLATTDAMGVERGEWGWKYEVRCEKWVECDALVGHVSFVSQTRHGETGFDPDGPGVVTRGTIDAVQVDFAPDGKLAGGIFFGMKSTSHSSLAATGPQPSAPAVQAPLPADPTLPSMALAAGGLSLLAALAYFIWPLAKHGIVGLFSRVQPNRALDHPTRARISELITSQPGIHGHDLARTTDLHRSTVDHHVRKLIEAGHVTQHRAGGYTCYFPRGTDNRLQAAAPVLKSETARKVLHYLQASPGTAGDVAKALGISRSTVTYHTRRMEDAGILRGDRRGAAIALHVQDVPV